jgi:hypothetical protein
MTTAQRTITGTLPRQIDAVRSDTRLVTITAGGNDAGCVGALTKISIVNTILRRVPRIPPQLAGLLHGWAGAVPAADKFDAVASSLTRVVETVRRNAPQARIVLVDYVSAVDLAAPGYGGLPLTEDEARQVAEPGGQTLLPLAQVPAALPSACVRAVPGPVVGQMALVSRTSSSWYPSDR